MFVQVSSMFINEDSQDDNIKRKYYCKHWKAVSEVSFVKLRNTTSFFHPCGHIFVIFFGSHQQALLHCTQLPNLVKCDVSNELASFFKEMSTRGGAFAFNSVTSSQWSTVFSTWQLCSSTC